MDESSKFTLQIGVFILVALLLTLSILLPRYQHDQPETDCGPYDYPICQRSATPNAIPPPSLTATFLSIVATATLAIILIYASYHASVIEQAEIITPTAAIKAEKTPGGLAPPAAQPAQGVDTKNLGA